MNNLSHVIGFTVRNKLRTKSFIITSLVIAVILTVVAHIPFLVSTFSSDEPTKVGIVNDASSEIPLKLQQYFKEQKKPDVKIVLLDSQGSSAKDETMLRKQIADSRIDGYLVLGEEQGNGFPKVQYKSEESLDIGTSSKLQTAMQAVKTEIVVKDVGLTQEQLTRLFAPVSIDPVQISTGNGAGSVGEGKSSSDMYLSYGVVYALIIVLFMGIMITGQLIATEITTEKSSRVMEILITSVSPLTQMFGKILGMFIVGLTQILLFVVVAVINLSLPHNAKVFKDLDIDLSKIDPVLILYGILFYLLGYFLFATLFAAVGSLVSRTEDLGQAIMPITFLSLAGFYIAIFGINAPGSTFVTVASFIPCFTPYIMFLRIGMTDPALWQVWLSIVELLVTTLAMGWLSAKIYRTGVLMYGKRPSLKEIRKAMKAYKI